MEGTLTLDRFTTAQARVWPAPLDELRGGRKRSYWMWFVFPQLRGLGRSEAARFYGIADAAEARAWLAHPLLGLRLAEASAAVLSHRGIAPETILGPVDAVKLRSSMTLFSVQPGADPIFAVVLAAFYDGVRCAITVAALDGAGPGQGRR